MMFLRSWVGKVQGFNRGLNQSLFELDGIKIIYCGAEGEMFLTYKLKHEMDFSEELKKKVRKVAEYAAFNISKDINGVYQSGTDRNVSEGSTGTPKVALN